MTARDEVVALLAGLPNLPSEISVEPYAGNLENLRGATVMVRVDKVKRATAAQGIRSYEMTLLIVVGKIAKGHADDELDAALEDVLHALETGTLPDGVQIGDAERASFEERFPCYALAITVHTEKEGTTP